MEAQRGTELDPILTRWDEAKCPFPRSSRGLGDALTYLISRRSGVQVSSQLPSSTLHFLAFLRKHFSLCTTLYVNRSTFLHRIQRRIHPVGHEMEQGTWVVEGVSLWPGEWATLLPGLNFQGSRGRELRGGCPGEPPVRWGAGNRGGEAGRPVCGDDAGDGRSGGASVRNRGGE